jgi:hypothetical protein
VLEVSLPTAAIPEAAGWAGVIPMGPTD